MEDNKQPDRTESARVKSLLESLFYYRDLSMKQNAEIVDLTKRLARTEKEKKSREEALVRSHNKEMQQVQKLQKSQQQTLVGTIKELLAEVEELKKSLSHSESTKAQNEKEWENRWRLQEEKMAAESCRLKDGHRQGKESRNEALVWSHLRQVDRLSPERTALCRRHDKEVEELRRVQRTQQEVLVTTTKELLAEVDQLKKSLKESEVTKTKTTEDWENRWRLREEKVAAEAARLKLLYCREKEQLKETIRDLEGKMFEFEKNATEWAGRFKDAEDHLEALKTNSSRQRDELLQRAREVEEKNKLDIKVLVDRILHLNSLTSKSKLRKSQKEAARRSKEVQERPQKDKDNQMPSCFSFSRRPRLFFRYM